MIKDYSKNIKFNINIENLINIKSNSPYTLNDKIFSDFLVINNRENKNIKSIVKKITDQLNYNNYDNLRYLVGEKNFNIYLLNLQNNLKYCSFHINDYYFELLQKRCELTRNITNLKTQSSIYEIPEYDHLTHKTGRVKIKKGLNVLTITKNLKSKLIPTNNKLLIEIDFKSAEPSLLYNIIYNKQVSDVYSIFNIKNDRSKIKIAVISSLYGASYSKIKKIAGLAKKDIDQIKKIFNITDINNRLSRERQNTNMIKNIYGRHIPSNGSLLNYWLQSSTADFALSCFYDFYKNFKIDIKAIIHDAILFECTQNEYDKIKKLKQLTDPITNISIPIDKRIIAK
jgi:hypothetical protein